MQSTLFHHQPAWPALLTFPPRPRRTSGADASAPLRAWCFFRMQRTIGICQLVSAGVSQLVFQTCPRHTDCCHDSFGKCDKRMVQ
eukprot:68639-Chlamydomonas_euryale.AAC.1